MILDCSKRTADHRKNTFLSLCGAVLFLSKVIPEIPEKSCCPGSACGLLHSLPLAYSRLYIPPDPLDDLPCLLFLFYSKTCICRLFALSLLMEAFGDMMVMPVPVICLGIG